MLLCQLDVGHREYFPQHSDPLEAIPRIQHHVKAPPASSGAPARVQASARQRACTEARTAGTSPRRSVAICAADKESQCRSIASHPIAPDDARAGTATCSHSHAKSSSTLSRSSGGSSCKPHTAPSSHPGLANSSRNSTKDCFNLPSETNIWFTAPITRFGHRIVTANSSSSPPRPLRNASMYS